MPGMLTSSMAAWGRQRRAASSAVGPSDTRWHSMPEFSRAVRSSASTVESSSATSTRTRTPPAAGGVRVRVLVADDDSTVLALLRTALENSGMECHLVSDGPTALDAARRWRPQAAILDVNMPGMDGYEVLAAMRAEYLPVRVMLLTARQQHSDIIRGFTLGADDYVVKPFSPMELVARLNRLILR